MINCIFDQEYKEYLEDTGKARAELTAVFKAKLLRVYKQTHSDKLHRRSCEWLSACIIL